MPKRIHKIVLDSNKSAPLFEINKLDSLHLEVEVTEVETLENAEVELFFKKSDGTLVSEIISEKEQNILKIDVKNGALDVPGIVVGQAKITEEDGNISSHMFKFNIKNSITSDDAIVNEIGIGAIEELKKKIDNAQVDPEVLKQKIEETINNGDLDVVSKEELKQVNSQLDTITNDMSKIDLIKTNKNLFNKSTVTENHYVNYSNGNLTSDSQYFVSDFIKVLPGEKITSNSHCSLCFYDENKNYIGGINGSGTTGKNYTIVAGEIEGLNKRGTYTIPSNCCYIRYNLYKSKISSLQLEYGTEVTEYEEYKVTIDGLKVISDNVSTISKSGNTIIITLNKARYTFKKVTDSTINIDTWRLYQGDLIKDGLVVGNMWTNSDAEGAIRLINEEDFVSGYHGDEIMNDITIIIDDEIIDLSNDFSEKNFCKFEAYVKSTVYHCNTSTQASTVAFNRVKYICIGEDKVTIKNKYIAQHDVLVRRACLALIQCYKKYNSQSLLKKISNNFDYELFDIPEGEGTISTTSSKMTNAKIYTTNGVIDFNIVKGQDNSNYAGFINNFADQNRIKVYFDIIKEISTGVQVRSGESIQCEFEFSIK